eukprot:TRINITY_DN528_c0_g1_i3.p2 TRINITY_DN528_c0_g1~~TRINITY_DN528_c0_g1_i3.p2  ORF type:complete len:135 (-),score=8.25 TRINITY_DN528_c0_g1_i3:301-705(-)
MSTLPGYFGPPQGCILLAQIQKSNDTKVKAVGIVALRSILIDDLNDQRTCEMKRLYVQPEFQQRGIGKLLVLKILEMGRKLGYQKMVLDTHSKLESAIKLYSDLGFQRRQPYSGSSLEDIIYMEINLYTATNNN